jgi:hypothetical protein
MLKWQLKVSGILRQEGEAKIKEKFKEYINEIADLL